MRIWYVVGTVEYFLEPQYTVGRTGRVTIMGCKLYDRAGSYKGYWDWKNIPLAVRRTVRDDVGAEVKRHEKAEKYELQAIHSLKRRKVDTE